jgi:hypothetical protein
LALIVNRIGVTICNQKRPNQPSAQSLTGINGNWRAFKPRLLATEPAIAAADLQSSVTDQHYLQLKCRVSDRPENARFRDFLTFHFLSPFYKASRVHKTIPQNKFQMYSVLETYWTRG